VQRASAPVGDDFLVYNLFHAIVPLTWPVSYMIIKSVFDLAARGRGLPDDALRFGRAGKSKTNWTKPPGALPVYGNCMG
jgi:hypothetical protein